MYVKIKGNLQARLWRDKTQQVTINYTCLSYKTQVAYWPSEIASRCALEEQILFHPICECGSLFDLLFFLSPKRRRRRERQKNSKLTWVIYLLRESIVTTRWWIYVPVSLRHPISLRLCARARPKRSCTATSVQERKETQRREERKRQMST